MAKHTQEPTAEQIHEAQVWLSIERTTWHAQQRNNWAAQEAKWEAAIAERKAAAETDEAFAFWQAQQLAKEMQPW